MIGLIGTWYFNLQMFTPGALFDLAGFYRLGFANPASSSLTMDLIIKEAVFKLISHLSAVARFSVDGVGGNLWPGGTIQLDQQILNVFQQVR